MSKHTPERWEGVLARIDYGDQIAIMAGTELLATVASDDDRPNAREYSRRLVACWNGCEGINPEAVKDLLEACKMISDMAVAWEALTPGDIAEVNAAIKKAEAE